MDVGLDYLTLDRSGPTLSAGEAQRLRLASQLGAELSGVLYVLDEPTAGVDAASVPAVVALLERLRGQGNTVLVVEHHEAVVRVADHVLELGPGPGLRGGQLLFAGVPADLVGRDTPTGALLAGSSLDSVSEWLLVAAGFDVLYFFVGLLTLEFVLAD